ncbi:hypothetical protein STRTUCAR8_04304 [Streptomyces turgidiscabies Car8]|uniref:Uncharacterized protein n=1 Tax=Streptomyces turgidiscabies (strain Car8) TaxID=698760 RepID=L7F8Q0_STRT8|nr:hypothetical protein STRTUCAR8_04304 [Streptomyces turgidiscabies Car8]
MGGGDDERAGELGASRVSTMRSQTHLGHDAAGPLGHPVRPRRIMYA